VLQGGADEKRKYTEIVIMSSPLQSFPFETVVNITSGEFAHKCTGNAVADYRI
jgi:hypothetical protein